MRKKAKKESWIKKWIQEKEAPLLWTFLETERDKKANSSCNDFNPSSQFSGIFK